jgi:AraC-like DNA-binding protein
LLGVASHVNNAAAILGNERVTHEDHQSTVMLAGGTVSSLSGTHSRPFIDGDLIDATRRCLPESLAVWGPGSVDLEISVVVAMRFVENSYQDPRLRLVDVARHVRRSQDHISRLIKKRIGVGFREYLIQIRLRAARQQLLTTLLSVKEIAATVGYECTSSFDREFKRFHGHTPTEWRKMNLSVNRV